MQNVPGFLGYEVTDTETRRIFISYWESMEAIDIWRKNKTHLAAKARGREWYAAFHSMLVRVESHSMWQPELIG